MLCVKKHTELEQENLALTTPMISKNSGDTLRQFEAGVK